LIRNDIDRIKRLVDDDKPLIAITLCGQVARTELQSKLKYLLDADINQNIVLIIVMNEGTPRFTGFANRQQAMTFNGTLNQLVDQISDAMPWPIVVLQTDNDEIATQTPLIATEFFRSQTWSKNIWHRASTVSQQFTKYAFATSIIEHVEQQLHFKFDYVIKLRDDDLLLATFNLNYVIDQLELDHGDIALVGCVWSRGALDDHLRVMRRRALNATSYDLLTMVCCFVVTVRSLSEFIEINVRCIDSTCTNRTLCVQNCTCVTL
jgi:hypothetical protein